MAGMHIVLRDGAEVTLDLSKSDAQDLQAAIHGALTSDGRVKIIFVSMPDGGETIVVVAHIQAVKMSL
jgi:predicted transcriptional regulator